MEVFENRNIEPRHHHAPVLRIPIKDGNGVGKVETKAIEKGNASSGSGNSVIERLFGLEVDYVVQYSRTV